MNSPENTLHLTTLRLFARLMTLNKPFRSQQLMQFIQKHLNPLINNLKS